MSNKLIGAKVYALIASCDDWDAGDDYIMGIFADEAVAALLCVRLEQASLTERRKIAKDNNLTQIGILMKLATFTVEEHEIK